MMCCSSKNSYNQKGFTLVELSMVLVIISLVVGGVLTGQTLIKAAEINSAAAQYQQLVSSINAFDLKYNAMPGDATNDKVNTYGLYMESGPNSGPCSLVAGDPVNDGCHPIPELFSGNGQIDDQMRDQGNFFQHLSRASLVEKGYTFSGYGVSGFENEELSWMIPKIKRGIIWPYFCEMMGNCFVYGVTVDGTALVSDKNDLFDLFSTEEAFGLDAKLDDGNPGVGFVRVMMRYNLDIYDMSGTLINTVGIPTSSLFGIDGASQGCCDYTSPPGLPSIGAGESPYCGSRRLYSLATGGNQCSIVIGW